MQINNFKSILSIFILAILSIFFNVFDYIIIYIVSLLLHEFVHFAVAKKLGYKFNKLLFMPYGSVLYGNNISIIDKHEIYIAISAPLFNILISFIFIAFWWMFPQIYEHTFLFVSANISLGFFNLLPVLPLDGGRIFLALIKNKSKVKNYYCFFVFLTVLFVILFVTLFIFSCLKTINLTYLFISIFLVFSLFDFKKNKFSLLKFNQKNFDKESSYNVKRFVFDYRVELLKLVKYIKDDYYSEFVFLKNGKVVKILTEDDLIAILKKV